MMDYVNKSTSQQLVERLGYNLEITIMSDVVHGLDYEYKQLEQKINKALKKINNMFDEGNEQKVIDDLLELERILKGDSDE